MPSKFLIVRKDLNLDQVVIESDGLTIGRLTGNDLALNHPTVSRTQAGIKQVGSEFWIFNLSHANGTLLNGELIERTPLADGDLIQIGPYLLTPRYRDQDLLVEVEASLNPLPIEAAGAAGAAGTAGTGILLDKSQESGNTVLLNLAALMQRSKTSPEGTRRHSDGGLLTGLLPGVDEQALRIFWEKRKREAGKLTSETPLRPKTRVRLGRAQFNWRPTLDLAPGWKPAIFVWGTLIVLVLAVIALSMYLEAFSPGPISIAHSRKSFSSGPGVALVANGESCTKCHTLRTSMQENCASCHTTPTFNSKLSDPHEQVGLRCLSCHSEHRGMEFRPASTANTSCVRCHSDGSGVTSPSSGKALTTPHGGTLGYPVVNGRWNWDGISVDQWGRRTLPGRASDFAAKEQFHLVHLVGNRQGRLNCTDCHTAGLAQETLVTGLRESCVGCHSVKVGEPESTVASTVSLTGAGPSCTSCHSQHGTERNQPASVRQNAFN